jgi:hypothetical protein
MAPSPAPSSCSAGPARQSGQEEMLEQSNQPWRHGQWKASVRTRSQTTGGGNAGGGKKSARNVRTRCQRRHQEGKREANDARRNSGSGAVEDGTRGPFFAQAASRSLACAHLWRDFLASEWRVWLAGTVPTASRSP